MMISSSWAGTPRPSVHCSATLLFDRQTMVCGTPSIVRATPSSLALYMRHLPVDGTVTVPSKETANELPAALFVLNVAGVAGKRMLSLPPLRLRASSLLAPAVV